MKKFLTVITLMVLCFNVNASLIYYNDEASFNSAGYTGLNIESWETDATSAYFNGGTIVGADSVYVGLGNTDGSNALVWFDSVDYYFTSAINAFGIDFSHLGTTGTTTLRLITSEGAQIISHLSTGTGFNGFVGFGSTDSTFTHVSFTNTNGSDAILNDRLQYGVAAQVPEPSTLAIFALGMIGLASRRFKKK